MRLVDVVLGVANFSNIGLTFCKCDVPYFPIEMSRLDNNNDLQRQVFLCAMMVTAWHVAHLPAPAQAELWYLPYVCATLLVFLAEFSHRDWFVVHVACALFFFIYASVYIASMGVWRTHPISVLLACVVVIGVRPLLCLGTSVLGDDTPASKLLLRANAVCQWLNILLLVYVMSRRRYTL